MLVVVGSNPTVGIPRLPQLVEGPGSKSGQSRFESEGGD